MDWANERYVRLYTRDSTTWKLLSWQARSLFALMLRKVDRAGVLESGRHGARAIAVAVDMPVEVVEPALAELVAEEVVETTDGCFVIPNFIEAQETPQSDALRKRESRSRHRDNARAGQLVTKRDRVSQNVTECPPGGQNVTRGHAASRAVTLTLSQTDPSETRARAHVAEGMPELACGTDPGAPPGFRDPLKALAESLFQELEDGKARLRDAGVTTSTRAYGGLPPWSAIKPIHDLVVEFGEERMRHHVAVELADARLRGDGGYLSSLWTAKRVANSQSREVGERLGFGPIRSAASGDDPDSMESVLDRLGAAR